MFGVDETGVRDETIFKNTMKATLVKSQRHQPVFDYFFPLFFSNNKPPLQNILEQLTEEQQALLQEALQSLMGDQDALRELLERLLEGRDFSDDELAKLGESSGLPQGDEMYMRSLVRAPDESTGWFDAAGAHAGRSAGRAGGDGHERGSAGAVGGDAAGQPGGHIGADLAICRRLARQADGRAGAARTPRSA